MPWFVMVLLCICAWGMTDILYKKSSEYNDSLSHYKCLIWNGIVMAVAGLVMFFISDTFEESLAALSDNIYLIFVAFLYPIALFFGLLGKRHLDASVVSPLENIDGAMTAIMLYLYFLATDNTKLVESISRLDMIGTLLIILGVVFLGISEHKLSKKEIGIEENKKRHRLGALALIFPMIYNLVDAVSMASIGITVTDSTDSGIADIDFFVFEAFGFAVIGFAMWLIMLVKKKQVYNPFKKSEVVRIGAATFETAGTILFIFSIALDPILTSPIVSSYCLVTIIMARILLKEKLTKKQYACLVLLIIGIALLGVSEILKV